MESHVTQRIAAAFAQRPSILDGGLGTELMRVDSEMEPCLALLSVTRPELVRDVHASYQQAGAQWLTTHTFSTDPASLRKQGLAERSDELTQAAVACCRDVAGNESLVLGSVGPGPGDELPDETETRAFLECLALAGVDGLLFETQMDARALKVLLEQALLVRRARSDGLFIAVSLVVDMHGALPVCDMGDEGELFAELRDSGIDLLAFNCSTGSVPLRPALARVRGQWSGRLGAYPNAGIPVREAEGRWRYDLPTDEFAKDVLTLAREFDLDLVGGCCGVSPEHIRALATHAKNAQTSS